MPVSLFVCPYCKRSTQLDQSSFGRPVWRCSGTCDARVGCHARTIRPLGTVAKPELRRMREGCHLLFDRLWKDQSAPYCVGDRSAAYSWLSSQLDIPLESAHIGMLNEEQCQKLLTVLNAIFHPTPKLPGGWS